MRVVRQPARTPDTRSGLRHLLALDPAAHAAAVRPLRRSASHVAPRPSVPGPCARCRRLQPTIRRARAIGAYDGALRAIVHALKYDGRRSLAVPLGALMRERGADVLAGAAYAVPVPLHPSGAASADSIRPPISRGNCVCRSVARCAARNRRANGPSGRSQRHRNVRDAFVATRAARALRGDVVVLVDDVSTTGATLDACARVLKEAGVAEVRALTAARVVTPPR